MDAYDRFEKESVRKIMLRYPGMDEETAFGMFMLEEAVVAYVAAQALEDGLSSSSSTD